MVLDSMLLLTVIGHGVMDKTGVSFSVHVRR